MNRWVAANSAAQIEHSIPAGLGRRLGAMVSDSLIVVGLLFLASWPFVLVFRKPLLPSEVGWGWSLLYWAWMLSLWAGFFVHFWSRAGQTVGMRAWRIKLVSVEQGVSPRVALCRWLAALAPWLPALGLLALAERLDSAALKGAGQGGLILGVVALLWMYRTPARGTWHDHVSRTRVILLPKG